MPSIYPRNSRRFQQPITFAPSVQTAPTALDLELEVARLKAENEALKAKVPAPKPAPKPTLKVSDKGCVSVYGLGRFPVTLYRQQWERLLDMADEIRQFIAVNGALLKTKE